VLSVCAPKSPPVLVLFDDGSGGILQPDWIAGNYCTNEQKVAHLRKLAEQEAGRAK
jgi:hypothetical protein